MKAAKDRLMAVWEAQIHDDAEEAAALAALRAILAELKNDVPA